MPRYFIHLAYDGTPFNGWQIQQNAPSVQETLNNALFHLCREEVNVVGCGRTDTGVHAHSFYAHFDLQNPLEGIDTLIANLNHFLPKEIVIFNLFEVPAEAHARFDAISRTYKYYILRRKDPFKQAFTYFYRGPLDVKAMSQACEILMEHEDFTSFSKVKTDVTSFICKVKEAYWIEDENQLIFTITANRFLRNMVRAIVGTLLDVGKHKISLQELNDIITSKNRTNAGYSVPAKGLFLEQIEYPDF